MHYIGIDIGGTSIKAGRIEESGTVSAVDRTQLLRTILNTFWKPSSDWLQGLQTMHAYFEKSEWNTRLSEMPAPGSLKLLRISPPSEA
jgi:predicted NBD/HSP70 family sugar kinase